MGHCSGRKRCVIFRGRFVTSPENSCARKQTHLDPQWFVLLYPSEVTPAYRYRSSSKTTYSRILGRFYKSHKDDSELEQNLGESYIILLI